LPLDQVARRWHVARRNVRRLLQQGRLPFEQVNGKLRVPLEAVRRYETEDEA
jgi:excisionase family DNA binding protein